jgi:hypothetical protein
MPLLRRRLGADPCPEAEAFCAVADGEASEDLKNAIAVHAARCPVCRDLQQRLQAFDAPMLTGQEAESKRIERRLDSWLESFLASDAAVHRVGRRTKESHPHHWWRRLASPPIAWRMRWVLVPAATLAVVICSFLAGRLSAPRPRQLASDTTSNRTLSPAPIPAPTVAEGRSPERTPDRESQPSQGAPQTHPNPGGEAAVASSVPRRINPPAASQAAPSESVQTTETAALTPPGPSNSGKAPISPSAEALQDPREARAVETAEISGTAPSVSPAGRGILSSKRTAPSGITSMVVSRGVTAAREARAERSPAIPAPPVIRLDAGTRVWITLKSVRPRADGASEFRGVVLLPVTQSGAVLIGRNTEVSGIMTVRNGKRSVQILEFLLAAAHYRLRSASGEASLRLLGAGDAVEFDAGRVLETWMASVSTYEKLTGEPGPPE